jgi:hypothetical protein
MSDAKALIDRHLASRGVRLPSAGVATTGPQARTIPASERSAELVPEQQAPRKRRKNRGGPRADVPRGDVINPNDGVVVEGPQGHLPAGTSRAVRQVVEMPMPKTTRSGKFSR